MEVNDPALSEEERPRKGRLSSRNTVRLSTMFKRHDTPRTPIDSVSHRSDVNLYKQNEQKTKAEVRNGEGQEQSASTDHEKGSGEKNQGIEGGSGTVRCSFCNCESTYLQLMFVCEECRAERRTRRIHDSRTSWHLRQSSPYGAQGGSRGFAHPTETNRDYQGGTGEAMEDWPRNVGQEVQAAGITCRTTTGALQEEV